MAEHLHEAFRFTIFEASLSDHDVSTLQVHNPQSLLALHHVRDFSRAVARSSTIAKVLRDMIWSSIRDVIEEHWHSPALTHNAIDVISGFLHLLPDFRYLLEGWPHEKFLDIWHGLQPQLEQLVSQFERCCQCLVREARNQRDFVSLVASGDDDADSSWSVWKRVPNLGVGRLGKAEKALRNSTKEYMCGFRGASTRNDSFDLVVNEKTIADLGLRSVTKRSSSSAVSLRTTHNGPFRQEANRMKLRSLTHIAGTDANDVFFEHQFPDVESHIQTKMRKLHSEVFHDYLSHPGAISHISITPIENSSLLEYDRHTPHWPPVQSISQDYQGIADAPRLEVRPSTITTPSDLPTMTPTFPIFSTSATEGVQKALAVTAEEAGNASSDLQTKSALGLGAATVGLTAVTATAGWRAAKAAERTANAAEETAKKNLKVLDLQRTKLQLDIAEAMKQQEQQLRSHNDGGNSSDNSDDNSSADSDGTSSRCASDTSRGVQDTCSSKTKSPSNQGTRSSVLKSPPKAKLVPPDQSLTNMLPTDLAKLRALKNGAI
ncbi:hypothetical protein CC86DRAFT_25883 [Ophiobolus disseminans]|uniref:Uncharacterized protein n=1 Tax=Ophiobolus disseminans TaxID=1469910 RepID=A0A6A6ZYN9_9PLEO|nr:hypothetical protein CC86DRAFT_25883 [Ophiobolus disseminans]